MTFEGREIPSSGWRSFLRDCAKRPYDEMRDARPLQWVTRLVRQHPGLQRTVCDAWMELLGDADADVREQAIELLTDLPCNLGAALASTIGRDHRLLMETPARSDADRSLLGVAVQQLYRLGSSVRLDGVASRVLAAVEREADGWPVSFVIALRGDFAATLPKLRVTLERADAAQIGAVARGMLLNGPPSTERGFDEVAKMPAAIRDRFAAAVRELEDDDPLAAALGERAEPSRWPEYARRLGVSS